VENGSTTGTKQFVWDEDARCEARDETGNVTAQYFARGETIGGTSYYFSEDHLGSIREMTNSSGAIVWQQSFDPYGVPTTIVSTTAADFGYAGYYVHSRSGLNLTRTRSYNVSLGRFINRDPIEERGGMNLYAYVANGPTLLTDPSGTQAGIIIPPPPPSVVLPSPPVVGLPSVCQSCSGVLIPPGSIMPPGANPTVPGTGYPPRPGSLPDDHCGCKLKYKLCWDQCEELFIRGCITEEEMRQCKWNCWFDYVKCMRNCK
jgi:RHS repeat-associated protein